MSVSLILNVLLNIFNELINSVMNIHEFNNNSITYPKIMTEKSEKEPDFIDAPINRITLIFSAS
jgi:hypothetical protein